MTEMWNFVVGDINSLYGSLMALIGKYVCTLFLPKIVNFLCVFDSKVCIQTNRHTPISPATPQSHPMTTDTLLTLKLPQGYGFADLKLRRYAADAIDLDMDLFKLVCTLNGMDFERVLQNPGPVVTAVLTVWYKHHLADGGAPDALMEDLRQQGPHRN